MQLQWQSIEKEFGRLQKEGKKTHTNHVPQEGPEDTAFAKTKKNKLFL